MRLTSKGIGLAGAMVAIGLMAAAGVMFTKIVQQNVKSTKNAKNSLDLNSHLSNVTNKLLKDGICTGILIGQTPGFIIPANLSASINLQENVKIPGTGIITESLEYVQDGSGHHILARFRKTATNNSYGAKTFQRKLPISVELDGSGAVAHCHSDVSNAIDTAVTQSVNAVEQKVPLCIYQEESCGGFYPDQVGANLEVPQFAKSVSCKTRYRRHCWIGGAKTFHRTCRNNGSWNVSCNNGGAPSCYSKKETVCTNNFSLPFGQDNVKKLRKCCRTSDTIEPFDSSDSGTSGTTASEIFLKWKCNAPYTGGSVGAEEWEEIGQCSASEAASTSFCGSGAFHEDNKCCVTIPSGTCNQIVPSAGNSDN